MQQNLVGNYVRAGSCLLPTPDLSSAVAPNLSETTQERTPGGARATVPLLQVSP